MTAAQAPVHGTELAQVRVAGGTLEVVVSGSWSLARATPNLAAVAGVATSDRGDVQRMTFDTAALETWDSSLLIFLLECVDFCAAQRISVEVEGLPTQVARLLSLARAVPERVPSESPPTVRWLSRLGTTAITVFDDARAAIAFGGEIALACTALVTRRDHMRWREFWVTIQVNGSGALGIVALIALLVGVIIGFLGVVVLQRFGAGYYVSYLVGFGMLREMGALMTGIIIAGRTGAAFAAELGSMKISEELDAFTTLGISPLAQLVLPRVLGLFLMMPLLTIYADIIGVGGGMLVSATMLDLSAKQFMNGLLSAVRLSDGFFGVFKGTVFGVIVGLAGCLKGLQTGSDASAVGRSATSAVVLGITGIIAANAVMDWLAALLDV